MWHRNQRRDLREPLSDKSSFGDYWSTIWVKLEFEHPAISYPLPSLWQLLIYIDIVLKGPVLRTAYDRRLDRTRTGPGPSDSLEEEPERTGLLGPVRTLSRQN